jgi:hypothetical protein
LRRLRSGLFWAGQAGPQQADRVSTKSEEVHILAKNMVDAIIKEADPWDLVPFSPGYPVNGSIPQRKAPDPFDYARYVYDEEDRGKRDCGRKGYR